MGAVAYTSFGSGHSFYLAQRAKGKRKIVEKAQEDSARVAEKQRQDGEDSPHRPMHMILYHSRWP